MDEIILSKDIVNIIDTCLGIINTDELPNYIEIRYGIKIVNTNQLLLNPDAKEGNLIERLYPDITITNLDLKEYKNSSEKGDDNIFFLMYELECKISINNFEVEYFPDDGCMRCNILSINPKKNNIAGLIELYEFMKKLKEDNRISQDATIGPLLLMYC
jgi:hypothetical protein